MKSFGYDAAGNITSDGGNTYAYDNAGRHTSATINSQSWQYAYNAFGQRVRKTGGGSTTYYAYDDQGHLIGEYSATGTLIQETVWLDNLPLATLRYPAGTTSGAAAVYYIHADHLGTPRRITRPADNQVMWQWESEPFGNSYPNENPQGQGTFVYNLRFPGQLFDQETGTHYNYFRDCYDPATGRYCQPDPIGLAGGINPYVYVDNAPTMYVDPLGLYTEIIQWGRTPEALSWGHISGNINGQNWSFGPKGWDTRYPTAEDYANRQADSDIDRAGRGIVLDLSPLEEALLAQCLKASGKYGEISNNCGNPWVQCLSRLGIVDPRDKARVLPSDVYRLISKSPRAIGNTWYPGTRRPLN